MQIDSSRPYIVDENGNIFYPEVLNELPDEDAFVFSDKIKASATMDQYISNIVVTAQNGNYSPTIKYTVKMAIPVGVDCYLGYEFPAAYGKVGKMVALNRAAGTYTLNLGTVNFIGKYNFRGKLTARDYSEYKDLKTVAYYPTGSTTTYKEVSDAEALSNYTIGLVPALIGSISGSSRTLTIIATTVGGWSAVSGAFDALSKPLTFTPKAKNYIKTVSSYDSTGMTITMTTYRTKTDGVVENITTLRYNYR